MKEEKEHLYELIISQLLFDEHISIADQLFWAVQCSKSIVPGCELTEILANKSTESRENCVENEVCICGHPGPSCRPVSSTETGSIGSTNESKTKYNNRSSKEQGQSYVDGDTRKSKRSRKHRKEVPRTKKKRGRPKKRIQVEVNNVSFEEDVSDGEDGYQKVDDWKTLESLYKVKSELTEDTSDVVSELDSGIQSTNADDGGSKELCDNDEIEKLTEKKRKYSSDETGATFLKEKRKKGKSRSKHKNVMEKRPVVPKRAGIANKLIKRAMREARKEPKAERKKRTAVFMCNLCLSKFNLNGLKEHLKEHCTVSGEELRCNLCDKLLMCGNRILNFNSHLRLHGSMQHFLCSVCGTGFKSEGAYKYHKEMHKDKRHTCEICQKSFKARGLLRSHMMTHSSVKSHICEYCAKGFRTATLLAKHVMIHTGEKPYRCDECGAEFRMSSHLRRHKDVHAGRKMYVCSVCNHAVYQRTNMRVHMKVHTGVRYSPIYVCNKCKMAFSTQEKLDEHAAGCRLTESAYEQQQRLGLQQKPAPLRVKRSRQSKGDVNDWVASDNDQSVASSLLHVNHQQSPSATVPSHLNQPVPDPPAAHQQLQVPVVTGTSGHQQTSQNAEYLPKPLVGTGRLAPQQFTSGVQDLQHLQHQQQDIIQQQSQFLQQLHAHQLYPQFYMQ